MVTLQGKTLLAPMAGVTDAIMRQLCREQGADLAFTEMVSSKALSYANTKTQRLLALGEGEDVVAVQLFGHEPETMAAQALWVQEALGESLALLDINMGCPARKIAGKGDGAALMKDPALAASLVRSVVERVSVPVSCKFRRGWQSPAETAPDFARAMEQAGASCITVHGRFADQLYRGSSDHGCIRRVKDAVSIPVIGNGDIFCADDALALLEDTGCDALMVARGAQGNPWIFAEIKAALAHRAYNPPTIQERLAMVRRHAEAMDRESGGGLVRMRKHAQWYLAGLPGARQARSSFNEAETLDDFIALIDRMEAYASRSL